MEAVEREMIPKRGRGLGKATLALREGLLEIVANLTTVATVRQMYYLAVSFLGGALVPKTEAGYRKVQGNLVAMRRDGSVSYDVIADNTRWMRRPTTYSGLDAMLESQRQLFLRDLWQDQDAYVEVWCEKDSLAGVVMEATYDLQVPLMVSRGFSSESFLYSAAETMAAQDRPCFVYLLSDYDRAGFQLSDSVESGLRRLTNGDVDLTFQRLALTTEQLVGWTLQTRSPKERDLEGGWRHLFQGGCAELEAIPPQVLVGLVREAIMRHVDPVDLATHEREQALQQETLDTFLAGWRNR